MTKNFLTFIFKVGSSYSAEDLALQTVKYGAKQVICTYRNQPMGFKWPAEITERPIFTHVEGKTVHFSGKIFFSLLDNAPNYVPSYVRYPKEKKICSMIILCTFECDVCKNTKI